MSKTAWIRARSPKVRSFFFFSTFFCFPDFRYLSRSKQISGVVMPPTSLDAFRATLQAGRSARSSSRTPSARVGPFPSKSNEGSSSSPAPGVPPFFPFFPFLPFPFLPFFAAFFSCSRRSFHCCCRSCSCESPAATWRAGIFQDNLKLFWICLDLLWCEVMVQWRTGSMFTVHVDHTV